LKADTVGFSVKLQVALQPVLFGILPMLRQHWLLDPTITYLNHGSYGATPIAVLARQQALRQQLETEPVQFLGMLLEPLLDESRQSLADFIGARAEDLVFVSNATTGVNTVLHSLALQPGDELLTTDQTYNACHNALEAIAQRTGVTVVVASIPLPLTSVAGAIAPILAAVTARTRLLLIDHITSPTALVLPIAPIIRALAEQGIDTLVDGAHAPGMVPLNLQELGAAYYTGNCHKWLCAPKGSGFLVVRADRQATIRPLVISHGANSPRTDRSRFQLEFDWTGTHDPTAYLCVGTAIAWMASVLPGGWPQVMAQNRQLAIAMQQRLGDRLPCPPTSTPDFVGAIAAIGLPASFPDNLQQRLFQKYHIEIPVLPLRQGSLRFLRLSAQVYNTPTDYDQLLNALVSLHECCE